MNVIARFSKLKALTYVGFNFIVTLAIVVIFLDAPKGLSILEYWLSDEWFHRPLALLAPIAFPMVCLLQISILRQLLFSGSRAVWISAGRLWFLNFYGKPFFSSLPVSDVDHLSLKPTQVFRSDAIIVHMKDGRQIYVPTGLLCETKEIVLSRLAASRG
ncbi:MAG TPA: hypothetical protein VN175_08105 [Rhizomicrobium sp.]|jgi:hypothetical protein|nr:hypothetical protein [Rhizomicrobium sp.]